MKNLVIKHTIITIICRENRGNDGAFEEAVERIRKQYHDSLKHYPNNDFHLKLELGGLMTEPKEQTNNPTDSLIERLEKAMAMATRRLNADNYADCGAEMLFLLNALTDSRARLSPCQGEVPRSPTPVIDGELEDDYVYAQHLTDLHRTQNITEPYVDKEGRWHTKGEDMLDISNALYALHDALGRLQAENKRLIQAGGNLVGIISDSERKLCCPGCGKYAGHDREYPPNPYWCDECASKEQP